MRCAAAIPGEARGRRGRHALADRDVIELEATSRRELSLERCRSERKLRVEIVLVRNADVIVDGRNWRLHISAATMTVRQDLEDASDVAHDDDATGARR